MIQQSHSWVYIQKRWKLLIWKDTCTPIFIAALFTITKSWNQPKWLLTEECIKKMWYIYTIEYYSSIKKNDIMPFAVKWMKLMDLEMTMYLTSDSVVKNPPATLKMRVWSLGREDPLEEEMSTHSSILAGEIPQTEKPRGLRFMRSQKSQTQLIDYTTTTTEMIIQSEVRKRKTDILLITTYKWNLKWYKWMYLQDRNSHRHRKQTYSY